MGADRKANTWESWFERRAAYLSDCRVELPLRPSAIAAPPSGRSTLSSRLRGWGLEVTGEPCQWALTEEQTLASRFERRAAYSSDCSVVLPLRPSARVAPPLGPRWLPFRLCEHGSGGLC